MKKLIIIGSGGHAKVCIDILKKDNEYEIEGLLDDFKNVGDKTQGVPVIGKIDDAKDYADTHVFFIAIGDNYGRMKVHKKLFLLSLTYINIIDPSASVSSVLENSEGIVVMPGAVINAGSFIGDHAIINTGATVDHDNVLMDFSSIGPGAHTGGNVHIGRCSHIGIGATVNNQVTVGEHTVIGAGSVVLKFIAAYKTAYGVPCLEIKDRAKGDKYL